MITAALLLFFIPLASGLLIYLVPEGWRRNYRLILAYAGAYLFSVTVVHLLPELFTMSSALQLTGMVVLAGFFLQQFLEFFTSGVDHGHIHLHHDHHHEHAHREISSLVLLSAMCLHAFLEGGILIKPQGSVMGTEDFPVLLGVLLHHAPAAFALMAVITSRLHTITRAIPHLIVFCLAAPAGLFLGSYLTESSVLSGEGLIFVYALVSGNFLYISTTILFESSPDHQFNARKLAIIVLGALTAVIIELAM